MNYINRIILIVFLVFANKTAFAQTSPTDTAKFNVVQDSRINSLLEKHIQINSKAPIKGYRVKIHFGSDKSKAKEVKAKFISKFPDVPAYEKYDQPNFNIRVGDFRTKLEAYKFLKQLSADFPSAFIVQDDIDFPSIENQRIAQ